MMNSCSCAPGEACPPAEPNVMADLVLVAEQEPKKRGRKAQSAAEIDPYRLPIHQLVRWISKSGQTNQNADPLAEINSYIGSYLAEGYRLVNTHYLGENPEGYGMLYVLVLDTYK